MEPDNIHSVIALPDEETVGGLKYQPPLSSIHLEVSNMIKGEMCLKTEPHLLNAAFSKMDKVNNIAPCLDVDIEKGKKVILNSSEESTGNLKSDDFLARILQREICLQIGGKVMQYLVNHGPDLTKFTPRDKALAETNRARKYKRSSSFNSRRVLLIFSILSSMGTIVLIYLTLRVRQMSEGLANV